MAVTECRREKDVFREEIVGLVDESYTRSSAFTGNARESLGVDGEGTADEKAVNYERHETVDGTEEYDARSHTIHAPAVGVMHMLFVLPYDLR